MYTILIAYHQIQLYFSMRYCCSRKCMKLLIVVLDHTQNRRYDNVEFRKTAKYQVSSRASSVQHRNFCCTCCIWQANIIRPYANGGVVNFGMVVAGSRKLGKDYGFIDFHLLSINLL